LDAAFNVGYPIGNIEIEGRVVDQQRIREAVAAIIEASGDDPGREGLRGTPDRVARLYADFFAGLDQDPREVLRTGFQEDFQDVFILRDIPFFSICEHHLLPMVGEAHIGYIPSGRIVGASKLARALDILARRPQIQERLTAQLVDVIHETVSPDGVGAVLRAEHMCMSLRGVNKPGSRIVTYSTRGSFSSGVSTREDLLAALDRS
jgi:GTP cyclohydrolase I